MRYGGCLTLLRLRREAFLPTPRHQGAEEGEARPGGPRRNWARLLHRVCTLAMEHCP